MTTKQQKSLWAKLPQWAWKQGLRNNVDFTRNPDSSTANPERDRPQHCADIKQAQVITSRVEYPQATDMHKPVLDIDFPVQCVPSTTPGHFHLYMDKELDWAQYRRLLDALADAGIIEKGYRNASVARKYTAVRVPWLRKEAQPEPPAPEATETAHAPENAPQAPAEAPADEHATRARRRAMADRLRFPTVELGTDGATPRHHRSQTDLEEERRLATQAALDGVNRLVSLPDAIQPAAADAVLRNITEAHAQRRFSADQRLQREQRAMAEAEERAARRHALHPNSRSGVVIENDPPHPARGEQVRYNPMLMRYEDGTNWVSVNAIQRNNPGMTDLIRAGSVVANSVGWLNLVESYGHTIERDPQSASVTYNRNAHLFTVISDDDPDGSRPLTITEEMWREQINGRDSNHISRPLGLRLQNIGLPAASIGRNFARAWELGIQREPRPLRRPGGSDSIVQDVLNAESRRAEQEAIARAELAQHYTRLPEPVNMNVSGRWSAEGSDPIGDIAAWVDRYAAPAEAPNLTVSWTEPTPSEAPVVAEPPLPF